MATIEHGGSSFDVDEDGFLTKGMDEWNEQWVEYVKSIEGIGDMTDEHWKVVNA
ncbi:MAG: TusE/DsrC/DsvC family sulfur relay protein, partial [Desulfobulbaceae bacterium]|nr:TusE/DsrC/DsvC family sulfur relay protein [Desulfobulbaceae bacterium]